MFRMFIILFLLSLPFTITAQVDSIPQEIKAFILPGYAPLDYQKGDLNGDKKTDAILILKNPSEDTISDENHFRPFLLLIRQADNKLKQVVRNDDVIMCRQCGGSFGDPYESVMIYPGGFSVHFYGGSSWRWAYEYKFAYKPLKKNWYLIKESQSSFHSGDPETTMKDVEIGVSELGEVPINNFNSGSEYADSRWKVIVAKTYFYDSPKLGSKPRKGYLLKGNEVTGVRHLKNFIEVSFENDKGVFTNGFILKKDLVKVK